MKQIILFLMTYLLVFIIYRILLIGKSKKNSKKKPIEVSYLMTKYKLDLKKINYKRLLLLISIVSSLDISIIITIVSLVKSYLLEILMVLVLIVPVILFSYSLVGNYYKKKGMIINE